MTIASTLSKLATVVAASSGIRTAPTTLPGVLNSAVLPCAIILPGPAQWNEQAVGLYRQDRQYAIRVFVKPVAQGQGIDEGIQDCFPIMQALGYTLVSNPSLDNTVDHIGVNGEFQDTGVISGGDAMTYGGVAYHGFEFTVQITEKGT